MTLIRFDPVPASPVRACCGKRHPLPWAHPGHILCARCRREIPTPRGKRYGAVFCDPCEQSMLGGQP